MRRIINWLNWIDQDLDEQTEVKTLVMIGLGAGFICWTIFGLALAMFNA